MRVGLDMSVADNTREHTGISNYVRRLAEALAAIPAQAGIQFILLHPPKKKLPFWSWHVRYAREIARMKLDAVHWPANVMPWGIKGSNGGKGIKMVLTIHDLVIYKHPEWFPGGQWFATKFLVPRSIRRADRIVVPSRVTKRDVMELFGVNEGKVAVVAEGVEERFFKSDLSAPAGHLPMPGEKGSGYILFIGGADPRKNLRRVVEAYAGLEGEIRERYELWVAGAGIREIGEIREIRGLRVFGYVSDEDLPALYQNAALLVYPSLYEGFGLPVLEALAAGVPVVTSWQAGDWGRILDPRLRGDDRRGSGDVRPLAVQFVDPYSVDSILQGMLKYLSPVGHTDGPLPSSGESYMEKPSRDDAKIRQKTKRGIEIARAYTWERAAKETIRVYRNI